MSFIPQNPNGQTTRANSAPVTIASDQTALMVQQTDVKASGTITAVDTVSSTASGYANQNVTTGTPSANSFVLIQVSGASSVTFAIGGNLSGTLIFERSIDGLQWASFGCFPANTAATTSTVVSTGGTTGQGDFHGLMASHTFARIRCTAFTSGSASINIESSFATGTVSVNSPVRIMDPSGITANVKTASTAPVATDNSLVTTTSPNSPDIGSLSTIATNTSGVATATKQDTGNSSLSTIVTNTTNIATAARQDTGNTSLSSITTNTARIPAQGAAATTASLPVNIANDQTVPVSNANLTTIATNTGRIPNQGAALTSASLPVNIATDQTVSVKNNFIELTGSASSATNIIAGTDSSNYKWGSVQLTGTWSGQVQIQVSNDNVTFYSFATAPATTTNSLTTTITTNGVYGFPIQYRYVKVICTSYTSGTINAILELYSIPPSLTVYGVNATQTGSWTAIPIPSSSSAALTSYQATAITALTLIQGTGPRRIHRFIIQNPNTSLAWLQFFNASSTGAVTLGTTAPVYSLPILASGVFEDFFEYSDSFSAGIVIAATTTATGNTAPTTGLFVSLGFI